jgi:GNAT superfamily N-acetyltransferase
LSGDVRIRPAERADVPLLLSMVVELAEYERAADQVTGSEELLETALFGPHPAAEAVIAELGGAPEPRPHGAVGFALFYTTFSTWLCRPGIWLEDLYVSPAHRGSGVGGTLISHLARLAVQRGCGRLDWSALDWNVTAVRFYEKLGATRLNEWRGFRLSGPDLEHVAQRADPAP